MPAPTLTIITITFNAGQYLPDTLNSVQRALIPIAQEQYPEYLIIDGGSGDDTLSIAGSFPFITRITSEPDKGLYDAMNKGLRLATGKYVWFLNAGDEVFNASTLQLLLIALESGRDIYYSDAMFIRPDKSEMGLRGRITPHRLPTNLTWKDMALGMKVCHQAFIVRRTIAPFYDIENLSADLDWEISSLKGAQTVQFLNSPLCRYLLGGLSVQNHKRSLTDRWKILQKHFGFFPTLINHFRIILRGAWFLLRRGRYW